MPTAWEGVRARVLTLIDYACFTPLCARPAENLRRDPRAKFGFNGYCAACWKARGGKPRAGAPQRSLFR